MGPLAYVPPIHWQIPHGSLSGNGLSTVGGEKVKRHAYFKWVFVPLLAALLLAIPSTRAQQTLGAITGTVTDSSGAVVVDATVSLVSNDTSLTRVEKTNSNGIYLFVNLPIGSYTLTFTQQGFQSQSIPSIQVQASRTATVNAELKLGSVNETVTVAETPLLNAVDTTNGYVMDKAQIDAVPLPTGSFTGLAVLSPGVSAELPGGTGANAGLGNAPVWANGERDTSNTYLLNGVDAKSLFNGKSTSQVLSARIVNNTGNANPLELSALPEQSSAAVYLAIGESIPTPAPETISEVRVNTSMYDAQQGSTSGAHIDMSTASGTNDMHGSLYLHRGTNWLNAAPYFYNADPNIPADEKNPGLHRDVAGGTFGTPIIKNKLFFYAGYQYTYASDAEIGISRAVVPTTLTNDRSPTGLSTAANNAAGFGDPTILPVIGTASGPAGNDINPIAYTLFNYKFPNGQYLIPSANPNAVIANPAAYSSNPAIQYALVTAFPENAEIPGTAVFHAYQGVTNLDWNPSATHSFYAKYYYQHDPTTAPYAFSMYQGFPQSLDAGSQVISLTHTQTVKPNLSVSETFGFIREKAYSTISQPFTPSQFSSACQSLTAAAGQPASAADCTINTFGSNVFPGMSIVSANPLPFTLAYPNLMEIGATAQYMGAFTGAFQNRFNPSVDAIWTRGKHTITFGGAFSYTQLNTRDRRNELGMVASTDFTSFTGGVLVPNYFYNVTTLLVGNPNRYWRANEWGTYIQDKFQFKSNLNITLGVRLDDDRGLDEKYGHLLNFDPARYSYDPTTDTISSSGLIVAGNNAQAGTPGVSASTLTGRQWGLAPRVGVAWSPAKFNSKIVVRAGWGMYYDRGELFSYLSPPFTQNIIAGGPFGINQQEPFVAALTCGITAPCAANGGVPTLENPWGSAADLASVQPSGNPATIVLPDAGALVGGAQPFYLGAYARNNKLPYTMNSSLDIQWQPRNDLALDIGYIDGIGRHEVIPIPFNQPNVASPTNPLCGSASPCASPSAPFVQTYTYGYTVQSASCPDYNPYANNCPINLPNGQPMLVTPEGGNGDLRVPYIGYAAESIEYTAAGISNYNALVAHLEKRLSFGLQGGVSYTYSKSSDEQSAMGLFYTGNNPHDLKDGYGPSDFDRTHVFNVDYLYRFPKPFADSSWRGKIGNGWGLQGLIVIQSGQPYSIVDFSGAVGSIFYSIYDGVTNPIVPLDYAAGCNRQNAFTGNVGEIPGEPALKSSCFTVPLLAPGALNGAIPAGDTFETNFTTGQRNIFRQAWQKRADISLVKETHLSDRFGLKYTFEVYNLTNHPSFDIPIVNVDQNLGFSQYPQVSSTSPVPGPALCSATNNAAGPDTTGNFYNCPGGLGQVTKTIGSPRQIQMSLGLTF